MTTRIRWKPRYLAEVAARRNERWLVGGGALIVGMILGYGIGWL
jgi:hypothetical protein